MDNRPKRYNVKALITAFRMTGWTLATLAIETRLSDSTLCRVFRKQRSSSRAINAVADALRVSRDKVWQ